MQLTYRSQSYTPANVFIPHTLKTVYRGIAYQYTVTPASSPARNLTYRGVSEMSTWAPTPIWV